jgi:putative restriction endonuclease
MAGPQDSDDLRAAVFAFLDEQQRQHGPYLTRAQINAFEFDGQPLALMVQNGIRTPSRWADPLSITSTNRTEDAGGYADEDRGEGLRLYRYMRERSSAAPALNRSLDHAAISGRPLIYFIEVGQHRYEPVYPVFITGTEHHGVVVNDEPATGEYADLVDLRRYAQRETRVRLHQRAFRSRVLFAYSDRCCICSLRYRGLLDAAHIVDDAHEQGVALVSNGLAMCRIHHGAYDQLLLGIDPDLKVEINQEVLEEIDGPMLRHGLQDMHGRSIEVPHRRADQPDRHKLAWKYDRFRSLTA